MQSYNASVQPICIDKTFLEKSLIDLHLLQKYKKLPKKRPNHLFFYHICDFLVGLSLILQKKSYLCR